MDGSDQDHAAGRKTKTVNKATIQLQNYKSAATTAYVDPDRDDITDDDVLWDDDRTQDAVTVRSRHNEYDIRTQRDSATREAQTAGPDHERATPRTGLKQFMRKSIFRIWAQSYRSSVRDAVANDIADLYYHKHHSETAFKAFSAAARWVKLATRIAVSCRNAKIKQAKMEADVFALNAVIKQWRELALKLAAERSNAAAAIIFHQSSLMSRGLAAFRHNLGGRERARQALLSMTRLAQKALVHACVTPFRNHADNGCRLDACADSIENQRDRNAKDAAIRAMRSVYCYRAAAGSLERVARRAMIRQVWKRLVHVHKYWNEVGCKISGALTHNQREQRAEQAVRREAAADVLTSWSFATKAKHATHYREFMLKYKAFGAMKPQRKERMETRVDTNVAAESQGVEPGQRTEGSSHIMEALSQRRGIIMAVGRLAKCLHQHHKRTALRQLLRNARHVADRLIVLQEMRSMAQKQLARRCLMAWRIYRAERQRKEGLKVVADVNYNSFLMAHAFDAMRARYVDRMAAFEDAIARFSRRQRVLHQRRYFSAFAEAVERSRALRTTQGLLQNMRTSNRQAALFEKFDSLSASTLERKIKCIADICSIKFEPRLNDMAELLASFRNITIGKRYEGHGIFSTFMARIVSSNLINVATLPIRSECIIFLYFLSGLRTRAFELIDELGLRSEETVVRVIQALSNADLAGLQSVYAYQLYNVSIDGFPTLNSSYRCIDATSMDGMHGRSSAEESAARGIAGASSDALDDRVGYYARIDGVPDWVVALLHRLVLAKVCNLPAAGGDCKITHVDNATAFELLRFGMPLWRLMSTRITARRSGTILREWKGYSSIKRAQRNKMAELRSSLEGIFNTSVRVASFNRWADCTRASQERRIRERNERCAKFVNAMAGFVYRSVSIVLMRLYLKRLIQINTGAARTRHFRALSKMVVVSCREGDASAEIAAFFLFARLRMYFMGWKMHTRWAIEVASKARTFYRTLFLGKGWNALHSAVVNKREEHKRLESSVNGGMRTWRATYSLEAWYKAMRCRQAFFNIKPPPEVVRGQCFRYWRQKTRDRARLTSASDAIRHNTENAMQRRILGTMHALSSLKQRDNRRIKGQILVFMAVSTAVTKVRRLIDSRLELTQQGRCREFFRIQRAMRRDEQASASVIPCNSVLYEALGALATLRENRAMVGITALQKNAVYNSATRNAEKVRNVAMVLRMFRSWRRRAAYNVRVAQNSPPAATLHHGNNRGKTNAPEDYEFAVVPYIRPSGLSVDRYCIVLTCFRHWRNTTLVLPGRNATELIEAVTTRNRQLDGLYWLRLHALSTLWNRTCETRLYLLVDSVHCKLKWSVFQHWKALARQRILTLYSEARCAA